MKPNILILFFFFLILFGCEINSEEYSPPPSIDGLSLYWDHEVYGKEGRRIRFEFYGKEDYENSYDLVFNYSINHRDISISLVDIIDNGKCPRYPTAFGIDTLCTPKGGLYIPDSLISKGIYTFTLKTSSFETTSELIIDNDSIILNIPSNNHFFCSIHAIYPIPPNLLFGSVVYSGTQNADVTEKFLSDLLTLGLTKTSVPCYPYRHLYVDKNGCIENSSWPPDNYLLGLLYTLNDNFKDVADLAIEYFNNSNINIYLYSSNGDQALLNKIDGIRVVYAE